MLRLVFQGVMIIVVATAGVGGVVMYREVGITRALVQQMSEDQKTSNAELRGEIRRLNSMQVNHERRPHGIRTP